MSHAFHSPHMDAILEDFEQAARSVSYAAPQVPLISNLTGAPATPEELCTPGYWVRHVRSSGAVRRRRARPGRARCRRCSWSSARTASCARWPRRTSTAAVAVPTLRRDRGEADLVVTALARLHVERAEPATGRRFLAGSRQRRVDLPTYAFQHQRFWPETAPVRQRGREPGTRMTVLGRGARRGRRRAGLDPGRRRRRARQGAPGAARTGGGAAASGPRWTAGGSGSPGEPLPRRAARRRSSAPGSRSSRPGTRRRVGRRRARAAGPTAPYGSTSPGPTVRRWPDGCGDGSRRRVHRSRVPARPRRVRTRTRCGGARGAGADRRADPGARRRRHRRAAVVRHPRRRRRRAAPSRCPACAQAAVWGLGRVAALEHPQRWGGLVDLPDTLDDRGPRPASPKPLADPGGEDQLAMRPGGGLRPAAGPRARPGRGTQEWNPTGTVLITGGTGALGAQVARRLAEAGARHLVLLSRRGAGRPRRGGTAGRTRRAGRRGHDRRLRRRRPRRARRAYSPRFPAEHH